MNIEKLYQKENDMKQFTKSDLRDCMKVVTRVGFIYIKEGMRLNRAEGHNLVSSYKEDLTMLEDSDFDIVEVYEPTLDGWRLLWKREEHKYMLLFPKEMYREGYSLIVSRDGTYQPYPIDYTIGASAKRTFTLEEINGIPFNTDIFTKVEIDRI